MLLQARLPSLAISSTWLSLCLSKTPTGPPRWLRALEPHKAKSLALRRTANGPAVIFLHGGGMKNRWMIKTIATLMAPLTVRPLMTRRVAQVFGLTGNDVEAFTAEAAKTRVSAAACAICQVAGYAPPVNTDAKNARTLFVAGDKEHALILDLLPVLAAPLTFGRAATAPGVGHGRAGENPDLFARTVSAWIGDTALPGELTLVGKRYRRKMYRQLPLTCSQVNMC